MDSEIKHGCHRIAAPSGQFHSFRMTLFRNTRSLVKNYPRYQQNCLFRAIFPLPVVFPSRYPQYLDFHVVETHPAV